MEQHHITYLRQINKYCVLEMFCHPLNNKKYTPISLSIFIHKEQPLSIESLFMRTMEDFWKDFEKFGFVKQSLKSDSIMREPRPIIKKRSGI